MPADVIDYANDLVEVATEDALRRVQKRNEPETHPDFDGQSCVECWVRIPEARLLLGKVRCVKCQSQLEYKGRT